MALADDVVALAELAGDTVITAAATDAWETVRRGIPRSFGRPPALAEGEQGRLKVVRWSSSQNWLFSAIQCQHTSHQPLGV